MLFTDLSLATRDAPLKMTTAIKFENISKQYRLGEVGSGTIADDLHRAWAKFRGKPDPLALVGTVNDREVRSDKRKPGKAGLRSRLSSLAARDSSPDYVWALQDIDFSVKEGEILGIIGRNGAGKSTLLKLLSRVTAPTTGAIKTRGRIASLLEVGTGFHPELTGLENIYLNGAILGMRRHEITRQLDAIIDFSGCGKYIDTPVKRYSSGMAVRLGFAVAAHLDCEILVVDEVLAVGDLEFQRKCISKLQDISASRRRTVLFVSHNMGSICSLCENAVVLSKGAIVYTGPASDAVRLLTASSAGKTQVNHRSTEQSPHSEAQLLNACIKSGATSSGNSVFSNSDEIWLEINVQIHHPGSSYAITAEFENLQTGPVFTTSSLDGRPAINLGEFSSPGVYEMRCVLPGPMLRSGTYTASIALTIPSVKVVDRLDDPLEFEIMDNSSPIAILGEGRRGAVVPRLDWEVKQSS